MDVLQWRSTSSRRLIESRLGNILKNLGHWISSDTFAFACDHFSNTLHKFKCPVFLYPVQFIVEGSLKMRRNLWSSMQKCKPFSHWPGQGCQQCSVYSGVYTCTSPAGPVSYAWSLTQWRREQLRSQPTPSVASGIDQATGAGVKLWWKCEEILALWSLQVKILCRNHTVVLYNFVIARFVPLVTINFEVSIRQWRVRVNEKTMNHNETLFTCRQWHDISYHSFEEEVINIKTKWAAAAQSLKDLERIQYLGMNCGRIPTSPPASPACFIIRNRRSISSGKGQRWVNMHILQPAYRPADWMEIPIHYNNISV